MNKVIHVAVATIVNADNEVLLALRQAHQHLGNLWEFPGGKVEADETVYAALKREIWEELAITVIAAKPLLTVSHDYDDRSVLLDVWHVDKFDGTPHGQEGQRLQWCAISNLVDIEFPSANVPIISALQALL
ncbi:MAG: 8-oxo-dGTP diphosphatase MutT [Pseudomonadota bacterium]|nr:8-oxo-dGTP diphosphatase MutT [Pseudomonadota bacterium]MDO7710881.1 8-oxo-dGTP diphosphatase MutT [Pseudomonadota bacterium]